MEEQKKIDIIRDFESLNLDPYTSDKAVIENMIRKHLEIRYSTKVLNQPLIDQIKLDVRKMLVQLKVNSVVKEKIIKNISSDLTAVWEKNRKAVAKKLKEMKKVNKKNESPSSPDS